MACDTTVAAPGPETPIFNTVTERISRMMLRPEESSKNSSGVLESPSARIRPDSVLYKKVAGKPKKIRKI